MKKLNLKNNKGITLITLVFTVVVILILTSMIIYNVPDHVDAKKLKNLYNDVVLLEEKIQSYYAKNGAIPGTVKYTWDRSTAKNYYIIDLQSLEGLTLNYGEEGYVGYKDVRNKVLDGTITEEEIQSLNNITDIYIVDSQTLEVYYVKGISLDSITYYTYD